VVHSCSESKVNKKIVERLPTTQEATRGVGHPRTHYSLACELYIRPGLESILSKQLNSLTSNLCFHFLTYKIFLIFTLIFSLPNMAQKKLTVCLMLVALVILLQGLESIEGRLLKLDETTEHQMQERIPTTNVAAFDTDVSVSPPTPPSAAAPGRDVDNFRPTAPGHSPGVGHSVHN